MAPVEQANNLLNYAWPLSRLGEALAALAEADGLAPQLATLPTLPKSQALTDFEAINRWVEVAADQLGIEAEPLEILYGQVEQVVREAGPALLPLPNQAQAEPHVLALL